jgi:hypothetical protein
MEGISKTKTVLSKLEKNMGIGLIIFLVIAFMILANSRIGRKTKMPRRIGGLRPNQCWGIIFFDSRLWLKRVLITLLKITVFCLLFIWRLIALGLRLGTPNFLKRIIKGV